MPEIINNDLTIKTLQYLYAKQTHLIEGVPMCTRESTTRATFTILQQKGYIDQTNIVTQKGINFLREYRLTDMFSGKYTPFGMQHDVQKSTLYENILETLAERPAPNYTLDHQPLIPELTIARAQYIASEEILYNKRIAFIGDYDSTNVALLQLARAKEAVVFDIDTRLLRYFRKAAKKNSYVLETVECDIFNYYPHKYLGSFDIFITDPPYAMGGMKGFLDFALSILAKGGVGFIAVPYHDNISWTEDMLYKVSQFLINKRCVLTDINKHFHRYQSADGLQSSMIKMKKGVNSQGNYKEQLYSFKENNINEPIISLD